MKKRLRLKKFKQLLQDDMLANVWEGSYQDKRRIMKMSHIKMIKELRREWLNQQVIRELWTLIKKRKG